MAGLPAAGPSLTFQNTKGITGGWAFSYPQAGPVRRELNGKARPKALKDRPGPADRRTLEYNYKIKAGKPRTEQSL